MNHLDGDPFVLWDYVDKDQIERGRREVGSEVARRSWHFGPFTVPSDMTRSAPQTGFYRDPQGERLLPVMAGAPLPTTKKDATGGAVGETLCSVLSRAS